VHAEPIQASRGIVMRFGPFIAILLLCAGPWGGAAPAAAQVPPFCSQSNNGAYSIAKARQHINAARVHLRTCAYVNGAPWEACRRAYTEMYYADVNLVQIFQDAFPSGAQCWRCNPRSLINEAGFLAQTNVMYFNQSRQRSSFANTVFNIESQADKRYCAAATPTVPTIPRSPVPPPPAASHNCAAAVAVGANGAWGVASRQPWETTALDAARRSCGGRCTTFARAFSYGCVAVATADGPLGHWAYAWAQEDDVNVASARAKQMCDQEKLKNPMLRPVTIQGRTSTFPCAIRVWACACRRPQQQQPAVGSGSCVWHRGFNNQVGCYCWQGTPGMGGHLVGPVHAGRCPRR
jgi:hypothetical protein